MYRNAARSNPAWQRNVGEHRIAGRIDHRYRGDRCTAVVVGDIHPASVRGHRRTYRPHAHGNRRCYGLTRGIYNVHGVTAPARDIEFAAIQGLRQPEGIAVGGQWNDRGHAIQGGVDHGDVVGRIVRDIHLLVVPADHDAMRTLAHRNRRRHGIACGVDHRDIVAVIGHDIYMSAIGRNRQTVGAGRDRYGSQYAIGGSVDHRDAAAHVVGHIHPGGVGRDGHAIGAIADGDDRQHSTIRGVDDRDVVATVIGDVGVGAAGVRFVGNGANRLRLLGAGNNPRAAK